MKLSTLSGKTSRHLAPLDSIKLSLAAQRLNMTTSEAQRLLADLHRDLAQTLGLSQNAVNFDLDFCGRTFDLVLTVNKQNKPKK